MTFLEMAQNRYSVRKFDSEKPVENEKIEKILLSGKYAPTACNYQPQKIYVIKSKEALEKLNGSMKMLFGAPLALLICYDKDIVWHGTAFGEPEFDSGIMDTSIIATTMMMEAYELGLGTLYVRGFDSKVIRKTFDIPENLEISCILDIGYEREGSHPAHLHSKRKDLSETVIEL